MNRRAFLQAALSLIPAPLLARLPIPPALPPIVNAVTPKRAVWTTPDTWAHRELITAERLNEQIRDTRVDFVPFGELVTFTTDEQVMMLMYGNAQLSEQGTIAIDLTIDGVRQGDAIYGTTWHTLDGKSVVSFNGILLPAREQTRGTHTYGIVQRVSNGTATTKAKLHVSEVW